MDFEAVESVVLLAPETPPDGTTLAWAGGSTNCGAGHTCFAMRSADDPDEAKQLFRKWGAAPSETPMTPPFDLKACGANISLSSGGYVAQRVQGNRQAVVLSSGPLEAQINGHYFEIEVLEIARGPPVACGMGIGVTHTSPRELPQPPDTAKVIPHAFVVGYNGSVVLGARDRSTHWRPSTLRPGQYVGVLITSDAPHNMVVFVDGKPVVKVGPDALRAAGFRSDGPFYPMVEVVGSALAVRLMTRAVAPSPISWEHLA